MQAKLGTGAPDDPRKREPEAAGERTMRMPEHRVQRELSGKTIPAPPAPSLSQGKPLSLSEPSDSHEREADRVAEQVMRMPVGRAGEGHPSTGRGLSPVGLQIDQRVSQLSGPSVLAEVAADIHRMRGRGEALTGAEQAFFEPRFGVDLSRVRIHSNTPAHRLARTLDADAFTLGQDVFIGHGGRANRQLLTHELVHVVQRQRIGTVSRHRTELRNQRFRPPSDFTFDVRTSLGAMIKAANVAQMVLYQMHDPVYGGRWGRLSLTFGNRRQIVIDIRGYRQLAVQLGGTGPFSPVLTIDSRLQDPIVRVMPTGELEVEGVPQRVALSSLSSGPTITRFRLVGGRWRSRVTDFSTRQARRDRIAEGARQLHANRAEGLDLILRAFRERLAHDQLVSRGSTEPTGPERQLYLVDELGQVLGRVVADLFAGGHPANAAGLQTRFVDRLHGADSPMTTPGARRWVLNAYVKVLLQRARTAPALAVQLLPALGQQLQRLGSDALLDHAAQGQLRGLAEVQLQAGNRAAALALFRFGAAAASVGTTRLLSGRVQGDRFVTQTASGPLPLDLVMEGVRREFRGLPVPDSEVARMRAEQIVFTDRWQTRARALHIFSARELASTPPTPEMMQRYFTARYNGRMPGQFAAMRTELGEYMAVAFLHTVLNVPEARQVWNSQQLPVSTDRRWAGDCGVMTRAVLHMLSGVAGVRFVPVSSQGHVRLLVLNSAGADGLLESNQSVHALAPGGTLEQRVRTTIARHRDLQVLRNMPMPISLGTPFVTARGTNIDRLYNTSLAGAETRLPGIDPALYAINRRVIPIIHRYDDYETRRNKLFCDWEDYMDATSSRQQAMQRRRVVLAPVQQQLSRDLAAIATTHSGMQRFLRRVRGLVDYGGDFLHGRAETPPHIIRSGTLTAVTPWSGCRP